MIAYLDSSALVKRYVIERGSSDTIAFAADCELCATSTISRAEVAATLAKGVRTGATTMNVARNAHRSFLNDWSDLLRVPITEALTERADTLAWDYGLRGYDAVHLAAALTWRESVGEEIVLATFDRQLWNAAGVAGLKAWPGRL